MNTLSATASLLTHSLALALLHSLWQGMLLYCLLFVALKAAPNADSRVKYYLSLSMFTGLFVWFTDTWLSQYERLKGITVFITEAGAGTEAPITYSAKAMQEVAANPTFISNFLPGVAHYVPAIMAIYSTGLALMLARILLNLAQLKALRTKGIQEPGDEWTELLLYWQNKLGIRRPVSLLLSARVNAPLMLGTLKPIILLPITTFSHLTTEQAEALLIHELAHIRRHDYLLNIFQTIAETILFFNPFVWLLSGIIRNERENCCDDIVVANTASPLPYAKALAILATSRINNQLTLAATGNSNQLLNRIKKIMDMKKKKLNYSQLTIIIAAFTALTFIVATVAITPSFAQNTKKSTSDTAAKKKLYKYKTITVDSNGKETVEESVSDKPLNGKKEEEMDTDQKRDKKTVHKSIVIQSGGSKPGKGGSISYSYSSDDDDDLNKVIKDITKATKSAIAAVSSIPMEAIEKEIDNASREIDNIDWDKIRNEVKKGIAEVDRELSSEKLHKEIRIELQKSKSALEKTQIELSHSRAHVREDQPGNNFEAMLDMMENDGLIDRSTTYIISKRKNELYINSQKQPLSVMDKYSRYLKAKSVSISGKKGALSITINDD
jgi:bla regulator protein BlaR1